jgi:hypothetical protein
MEQPPFELACRMKAKEIAAETYRGCVTENRKAQIDQVKSEYQAKLKALKDEYDQELKKAAGRSSTNNSDDSASIAPSSEQNQSNIVSPTSRRDNARTKASNRVVAKSSLPSKRRALRDGSTSSGSSAGSANQDMSVRLRTMPSQLADESSMDIPEPIPVESGSYSSDNQGI